MPPEPELVFPPFRLDLAHAQLWRGTQRVPLRPRALAVLHYLVAHAPQVVTQAEILQAVWGGAVVSEGLLRGYIRDLRAALGDAAQAPRFIATVARRGWRFLAPVMHVLPPATSPVAPGPPASTPTLDSLAAREVAEQVSLPVSTAAEPPLVEEYKLVTVLCGAVSAAPAPAAVPLPPEAAYRLMQTVVATVQAVLQRYEGTLMQVTAEGFTAVFGAPVAQEDHARRAVRAALEVRQHLGGPPLGETPAVRIGLDTGPVVVGRLGAASSPLPTAIGDTVQQALRVQRWARPGTIGLSAATHRLVHAEVQAVGPETLPPDGPAPSLTVYTLQGLTRHRAGVLGQGCAPRAPLWGACATWRSYTNAWRTWRRARARWSGSRGSRAWASRGCWRNCAAAWPGRA